MKVLPRKTPVVSTTEKGLKVFCAEGPGVLRLWIPFKHQLFIEYNLNDKRPLDVYGDLPALNRNPKYLALITKTFHQILIKDNKLEVQIRLDQAELNKASEMASHPELNHWLEEVAQILMAYNQNLRKRGPPFPLKMDQISEWILKRLYITAPALAALIFPALSNSSLSMEEWKDKIELLVGFGFVFGGLMVLLKVKLWTRIFTKFYLFSLSSLVIAFIALQWSRYYR